MMKWLLGPPDREPTACPRNLCQECYDTPQWKVHCKSCSKPLCIEHDLRGLRLRICGYRDLTLEKMAIQNRPGSSSQQTTSAYASSHVPYMSSSTEFALPYRTHRAVDSIASSFTEDNPADGVPDVGSYTLQGADDPPGPISLVHRRLRSVSVSNSNRSRSSSRSSVGCESQSDAAKWQGCQSFFCPQYRAVGDQRQRCGSVLRECSSCSVHVCQDCVEANPPCNCSYCEVNYLCPNCLKLRERDGTCRRLQEEKARREQRWKEDMQMLEGILETKMANEVAEFAGQFFNSVEEPCISVEQVEDVHQNAQSPHHVRIFDGSPWMGPIAEEDVVDSIE